MLGSVSSAEDITDKIAAQQTIKTSEARYRSLFEHVPVGIYQMSLAGEITTANPTLARLLGFDTIEQSSLSQIAEKLKADGIVEGAWSELIRGGEDIHERWLVVSSISPPVRPMP